MVPDSVSLQKEMYLPPTPQIPLYFSKITMYTPVWVYAACFSLIVFILNVTISKTANV